MTPSELSPVDTDEPVPVPVDTPEPVPAEAPGDGAVSWAVAERVGVWLSAQSLPVRSLDGALAWLRTGRPIPVEPDTDADALALDGLRADIEELTAIAEELVARETGLRSPTGPARARLTDRPGWIRANVASFQRLLGPHLARVNPAAMASGMLFGRFGAQVSTKVASAGRSVTGAQMGLILGWLSTRVLGQYDLLLTEEAADDQDMVWFVGPNILALEKRYGFDPRQFRLWIALHEVTHRCQFTAVPWMRDHFVSLVNEGMAMLDADPRRLAEALRRMTDEIRAGRNPLDDAGVLGIVVPPEQREALLSIQALMSLLEGHGDVTMDRAGAAAIPDAPRFAEVLRQRRNRARGPARLLQKLVGLEAKLRQYQEGEEFVAAVEEAGGRELLDRVWRGPEWLPSLTEIRDPALWVSRVSAVSAPVG